MLSNKRAINFTILQSHYLGTYSSIVIRSNIIGKRFPKYIVINSILLVSKTFSVSKLQFKFLNIIVYNYYK